MIKVGDIIDVKAECDSVVGSRIYHIKNKGKYTNGIEWIIYDVYYYDSPYIDSKNIKVDIKDMIQYISGNSNGMMTKFIDEAGFAKFLLRRK